MVTTAIATDNPARASVWLLFVSLTLILSLLSNIQALRDVLHAAQETSLNLRVNLLAPQIPACTYVNCYNYSNNLNLQSQAKNAFPSRSRPCL